MSLGEKLYLESEKKILGLKKELAHANELIEYYRQFQPDPHPCEMPPGFFGHATDNGVVMGRLIDGTLSLISKNHDTWEEAKEEAWKYYKELTQ